MKSIEDIKKLQDEYNKDKNDLEEAKESLRDRAQEIAEFLMDKEMSIVLNNDASHYVLASKDYIYWTIGNRELSKNRLDIFSSHAGYTIISYMCRDYGNDIVGYYSLLAEDFYREDWREFLEEIIRQWEHECG